MKEINKKTLEKILSKDIVKLYTYQHKNILNQINELGYITGSHDYSMIHDEELKVFKDPYEWMKIKLKERLKEYSGDYPIWASINKPNHRDYIKCCVPKEDYIRITFTVPKDRVVLSDFSNWHCILNNFPIVSTDEEYSKYEQLSNEEADKFKLESWNKVFELQQAKNYYRVIQVCVDRIYPEEITNIKYC